MAWNQKKLKAQIIDILSQRRIMEVASKKTGVPRSTIYRWIKDDDEFSERVEEARRLGTDQLIDRAELVIESKAMAGDLGAAKYILEHHSRDYKPRMRAPAERLANEEVRHEEPIYGGLSMEENKRAWKIIEDLKAIEDQNHTNNKHGGANNHNGLDPPGDSNRVLPEKPFMN